MVLTNEDTKIIEQLKQINAESDDPTKLNEKKIKDIFLTILVHNDKFNLADLWRWLLQNNITKNDEVNIQIAKYLQESIFEYSGKFRYQCTNCGKKYSRWPIPNPEPPYREDLKCHNCNKFDSIEPI